MTQYPEKTDSRSSDWLYPDQQQGAQHYPLPGQNPPYVAPGQSTGYAAPSQQAYYPPQGPPPDYGYVQSHPNNDGRAVSYDRPRSVPPSDAYGAPWPTSQAGPSSSSRPPSFASRDSGGSLLSLGSFFGNKGPPPMWQRTPPQHLPYPAFPPMCLISNNKQLSNGFPELPPPCPLNPHPFVTHDITEEDWKCFLSDVKKAGALTGAQRVRSNVIPLMTGMTFFTGFMVTNAIEKKMKYKNRQAAGDLVDHWNHYFFGPRRMEVVLCQASERLSGRLGAAPVGDPYQQQMANGLRQRRRGRDDDDDSFSSGSSDDDRHGRFDRHALRAARKERRREMRRERKEWRTGGNSEQPYQLFVTAI